MATYPTRVSHPSPASFGILFSVLCAALLHVSGCAGPTAAPVAESAPAYQSLKKGMTAAEVRGLLGAPVSVKPIDAEGISSEIWTYTRRFPAGTRQVAADMKLVPYIDPLTGKSRDIPEAVYKTEVSDIREDTELLMINGRLMEWKQKRDTERRIQ